MKLVPSEPKVIDFRPVRCGSGEDSDLEPKNNIDHIFGASSGSESDESELRSSTLLSNSAGCLDISDIVVVVQER